MIRRLLPIIKLAVPVLLVLAMLDLLVFRSGLYYHRVERRSTAGAVMVARASALRQLRPGMKNVLVLGDSRIGQGFSAKIANANAEQTRINYVGVAVPGSSPRVWYYFLRSIDPDARHFSAVALMADSLRDDVVLERLADRGLDLNYLVPLVGLRDMAILPGSFPSAETRKRARVIIAMPMVAMQDDIRGFVRHPLARIKDWSRWNAVGWDSADNYPGIAERLPDLSSDPVGKLPIDITGMRSGLQQKMRGYFQTLGMKPAPGRSAELNGYRNLWVGKIAGHYRQRGVPVILFQIPRGAFHQALVPVRPPNGAYAAMAAAGKIELLPADAFNDLEQPQYFFDHIHLNSTGRKLFSARLPAALSPLIQRTQAQ